MTLSTVAKRISSCSSGRLHASQRCSRIPHVSRIGFSTSPILCLECHRLPIPATNNGLQVRTPPVSAASPSSLGSTSVVGAPPNPTSSSVATAARPFASSSRRHSFRSGKYLVQRRLLSVPSLRRPFSSSFRAMAATKIDGTAIAKKIREDLHTEIAEKQKLNPRYKPSLKIIQGMLSHEQSLGVYGSLY